MCVYRNTVVRSRNVYTSSVIVTARSHLTQTEGFHGDVMSPSTIKRTSIFIEISRNFCPTLTKFGIWNLESTDFGKKPPI